MKKDCYRTVLLKQLKSEIKQGLNSDTSGTLNISALKHQLNISTRLKEKEESVVR
jgi:hypothetical protein